MVSPSWWVSQAWLSSWSQRVERSALHPVEEKPESRLALAGPSLPPTSASPALGHWLSLGFPPCKTRTVTPATGTSVRRGVEKGLSSFPACPPSTHADTDTHTDRPTHAWAGLPFQRRDFYNGGHACTNAAVLSALADSWVRSIWKWPWHHRSPQERGWAEGMLEGHRGQMEGE